MQNMIPFSRYTFGSMSLGRKSMTDAIQSTMSGRERFVRSCERLAEF